jgi:RHS repeat-associated protein
MSNRLLADAKGRPWVYDVAGNVVEGPARLVYDSFNKVRTVEAGGTTLQARYDSGARRMRTIEGQDIRFYSYGVNSRPTTTFSLAGTKDIVWLGGMALAVARPSFGGERIEFTHTNQLLDVEAHSSLGAHLTAAKLYGPDFDVIWSHGNELMPEHSRTIEVGNSGIVYNWNRYRDLASGRYLQPDPIGLEGGMNGYLFGNADSVNLRDVSGLECKFNPDEPYPGFTFLSNDEAPASLVNKIREGEKYGAVRYGSKLIGKFEQATKKGCNCLSTSITIYYTWAVRKSIDSIWKLPNIPPQGDHKGTVAHEIQHVDIYRGVLDKWRKGYCSTNCDNCPNAEKTYAQTQSTFSTCNTEFTAVQSDADTQSGRIDK